MFKKLVLFFLFGLISCTGISQTDTLQTRGTIKINKSKKTNVYIKASAEFSDYDLTRVKGYFLRQDVFIPFPVVEGYPYPFNYTNYFNNKFKNKRIDLQGRNSDTVKIEIRVQSNGKVFLNSQKSEPASGNDFLNTYCLSFIKEIDRWLPAYVIDHKKSSFKKQTVIKPYKKNITASGKITVIFSTEDFDN